MSSDLPCLSHHSAYPTYHFCPSYFLWEPSISFSFSKTDSHCEHLLAVLCDAITHPFGVYFCRILQLSLILNYNCHSVLKTNTYLHPGMSNLYIYNSLAFFLIITIKTWLCVFFSHTALCSSFF